MVSKGKAPSSACDGSDELPSLHTDVINRVGMSINTWMIRLPKPSLAISSLLCVSSLLVGSQTPTTLVMGCGSATLWGKIHKNPGLRKGLAKEEVLWKKLSPIELSNL